MRAGYASYAAVVFGVALSLISLVNACDDGVRANAKDGAPGGSSGAGGGGGTGGTWPPPCNLPCPLCGDGRLDPGEACDDGNTAFGDGCNGLCQVEAYWDCSSHVCYRPGSCGNGSIDPGEACDDGNQIDGDGCPASCLHIERDWYCPAIARPCKPIGLPPGSLDGGSGLAGTCGNGVVESGEVCDDGFDDAAGAINDGHYGGCTGSCQLGPHCGDGIVNGVEDCDLGDRNGIGTVVGSCTTGCRQRYCGDGFADGDLGEECDLGELNGQSGQDCDGSCKNVSGPLRCPLLCL